VDGKLGSDICHLFEMAPQIFAVYDYFSLRQSLQFLVTDVTLDLHFDGAML
jgi:hypothetical protein